MATPIIFFGNERLATGVGSTTPILRALIDNNYDVKAVVVHNEPTASRKQRTQEIITLADHNHIPVLTPNKPADIIDELKGYQATAGVLAAFGKIVPQSIIDIFPSGIINVHPSLLPLHRGPTPIESVILDGSDKTGVSLMRLAKEMDAGPVYGYSEYELTGRESKQELAEELGLIGAGMLIDLLPQIIAGEVIGLPQDNSKATYDNLITKKDGALEWRKPANRIEREIRAFTEWPKSHTRLKQIEVVITDAHVVPTNNPAKLPGDIEITKSPAALTITCGEDSLSIDRLKPAGKKEMSIDQFLAGYVSRLN